jgi:ribosomal protein S18 acetylase RimI-like enzyme
MRMFSLNVGAAFRRKGVGTALMEAVEQRARERGHQTVNLEVAVGNVDAVRLYKRRGYRCLRDGEVVAGELSWIMLKSV